MNDKNIGITDADSKTVQGWQPIETAPVNQSVLVYIPNAEHYGEGIYRAIWIESNYEWLSPEQYPRHWQTTGLHCGRDCCSQLPTHWMPLPEPPRLSINTHGTPGQAS